MQLAHVGFYNHRLVAKGTETVERREMGWERRSLVITQGVLSSKDITQTPSHYLTATCSHTNMKNHTPGTPSETQNLEYFPLKYWLLKIIAAPGEAKGCGLLQMALVAL